MKEPQFNYAWLPFWASITLAVGMFIGNWNSNSSEYQLYDTYDYEYARRNNFNMLLHIIEQQYVDSVNSKELTDNAMTSILKELDPHSAYIPAEDLESVNEELEGSFSGIGIQFNLLNDTINVVDVISGGPSERCGLMPGDRIITVDDSLYVGKNITNEKVMKNLRGAKGSVVKLGIQRKGESELLTFEVERGDIPLHSVDASFIISPGIGYILVSKFGRTTFEEFLVALARLRNEGAESYIIDLRGNGGGYMDAAINMVNEFMMAGELIVYTEGRAFPREDAVANGMGSFKEQPVIVLTDEWSASASEIFAGAIQDNDRGLVVGRRTFGKGLVQNQLPLSDGSAVRLTIARYHTPSGRCIQKDYAMGDDESYNMDILNRYNRGEFFSADSIKQHTDLVFTTAGGRTVYGGGGIMPDVFIPSDTTHVTPYYTDVINKSLLYKYAFEYVDSNRERLSQADNYKELLSMLDSNRLINDFIAYADKNGVPARYADIKVSRAVLLRLLQAYIARDVIGDEAFYPIFMSDDKVIEEACRLIEEGNAFPELPEEEVDDVVEE
ncbi:MAG: S41 family peptidase [Bacteroidaceae bacterium]|nr:S41 family peptidase [Bacteroidaceae bacterium]